MASKRNSRSYIGESDMTLDLSTSSLPSSQASYRSRRSSRSSLADDVPQQLEDPQEDQRNAVSIREASTIARAESTRPLSPETPISGGLKANNSATSLLVSSASSVTTESDASAPLSGRPLNFGIVVPGVYRSSYPKPHDFEYIQGLKLKTIVTLVKKDEIDHDLEEFVANNGIRQVIFNMKGTKKEAIPLRTMKSILSIILDRQNHPLLIHCNHGKHRTGCVVGVVRKVSGWSTEDVVDEYRSYAQLKIRECDVDYIRAFQVSSLREPGDDGGQHSPLRIKLFFRTLLFSAFVISLWLVSGTQITTVTASGSEKTPHDRLLK